MAVPKGIFVLAIICLPMDTTDMENTVREDSTPMVCTSKSWSTSISGLMMTPPPMPVREPTVVAPMPRGGLLMMRDRRRSSPGLFTAHR